ncbi:MAG: DUF2254 domain-containing protein [Ignavibacteriaceae bacterium]|nr:DUF2254 domain-containing protein [Ignavibacteriaceae bacterium]
MKTTELKTLEILKEAKVSWWKPLLFLFGISITIFGVLRVIDFLLYYYQIEIFSGVFSELDILANTLGGLGEVVTGVLGIEITVIAIIVQLAANKYSSKIMDLFVENRVNFLVIAIFVVTAINAVLVTNTLSPNFPTPFSILTTIILIIVSLLIVIPHFSYVFNFLRPMNFLGHVKEKVIAEIRGLSSGKIKYSLKVRDEINNHINFIGDIALNSVYQGDRAVTLLCISILREIVVDYLKFKKKLPEDWFKLSGLEYFDPDFSSYSSYVMDRIEENKVLVERKVFGLYELVFNNSRLTLRDVASGVLLNSELISIAAIKANDKGALYTSFQYFNSYLRIAIRGKDPRSAFNTLEHYRIVAEELITTFPEEVEKLEFYFKYYGQEANKNQILFILETAAHDLCRLNEVAYEKRAPNLKTLLELFLTLDEPLDESNASDKNSKEQSLIGVRIAQVKLAGFYLIYNEVELARRIFEDLRVEPADRIQKIKEIIFNTTQEEFWEITPRGINFYYVSKRRRDALKQFFAWFEQSSESTIKGM